MIDIPVLRSKLNLALDQALMIQSSAFKLTPDYYATVISSVKQSREFLASLEAELKRS